MDECVLRRKRVVKEGVEGSQCYNDLERVIKDPLSIHVGFRLFLVAMTLKS